MCPQSGQISEGELEVGKYMVFQLPGDRDFAIKTSLIRCVEFQKGQGSRIGQS